MAKPINWKQLRVGVKVVLAAQTGHVIVLGMILCGAFAIAPRLFPLAVAVMPVLEVLAFLGFCFCLAAPAKHRARTMVGLAVLFKAGGLVMSIVTIRYPALVLLAMAVDTFSLIAYLLFLRAVVVVILKDNDPAGGITALLVLLAVNVAALIPLGLLVSSAEKTQAPARGAMPLEVAQFVLIMLLLAILLQLASVMWYWGVLLQCHDRLKLKVDSLARRERLQRQEEW